MYNVAGSSPAPFTKFKTMKIDGNITILINPEITRIEIRDKKSNTKFCDIKLTPEQLSTALSRVAHTKCEIEVHDLDKIGKQHKVSDFVFEIPDDLYGSANSEAVYNIAEKLLKDGWVADKYFGSQNSFFKGDGKTYAKAIIRRWI